MILRSPTRNILWTVYEKTRLKPGMANLKEVLERERCLIVKNPKSTVIASTEYYLVGPKTSASLFLAITGLFGGIFKQLWYVIHSMCNAHCAFAKSYLKTNLVPNWKFQSITNPEFSFFLKRVTEKPIFEYKLV